jgi:hypothetical protein
MHKIVRPAQSLPFCATIRLTFTIRYDQAILLHLGKRLLLNLLQVLSVSASLMCNLALAQTSSSSSVFPPYLRDGFDYATFTRFDTGAPPKSLIYQSNGFLALQEQGFGGQKMIIPATVEPVPTNSSDRLSALEIDAPLFTDSSGRTYRFSDSPAKRSMTYFADRTVYRATFDGGPKVSLTVYPVYGKPAAVFGIRILEAHGPIRITLRTQSDGFQIMPGADREVAAFGSPRWPYRSLLATKPKAYLQAGGFQWEVGVGGEAALIITLGGTEREAEATLLELRRSPDLFDKTTHRFWNEYLASTPLVAPAAPIRFTIGTSGKHESIAPEELVRSELWFWRGVLNTTCQVRYLPACPMMIADWNVFVGMWSNDGIAEAQAIAATGRSDLARASILNWFRYSVNAKGDGTTAWTIFPSAQNTFQAKGPERNTQGVPVQASLVGEYVRLTGDTSILNEKLGGLAGNRTVWQALLAYQRNLLKVRDVNHDHLIDWLHTYETGWDDKNSPFIDLKGDATSSINEQVDNLWSLQEMVYLSGIQGEDPSPWQREFAAAQGAVRSKLWDPSTQRYWDLDIKTGKLWTQGENLDAYYFLYFETDPSRIAAMMHRLDDTAKFNGPLLPTLAFDSPKWGGYWRGPAWPRIFPYVAMGLARSGHPQEGFAWLSRAIHSNLGPLLPENVDPKAYPPGEHSIGSVRIMGYDALDTLLLPEVAGFRSWAGEDLTVAPAAEVGKVYIRGQKWMGDRYDVLFDPGHPILLWRNGRQLQPLEGDQVWQATKSGQNVVFKPIRSSSSRVPPAY